MACHPGTEDRTAARLVDEAEAVERALARLTWVEHKIFALQLEHFDLTPAQYHALVFLARQGQTATMGCLAEHLHQSSATVTGMMDRLVRRDLVERRHDVADRRRVIVRTTEAGMALLVEASAMRRQRTLGILATWTGDDRARLVALLETYLTRVTALLEESARLPGAQTRGTR